MEIHRGHRKRTKQRFLASSGADFCEHEILELLLFYGIPRRNTNEIAHRLQERFGTINRMAEASIDELKLVEGIGDNSAILLKLVLSLAKSYAREMKKESKRLTSVALAVSHARSVTMGATKEVLYAVFMDNSLNVIDTSLIAVGAIDEVSPLIRTVIELCVLKRATAVMLVHNHPNGGVEASVADVDFTSLLERELHIIGVHLVEHLIVDQKSYNPILKGIRRVSDINDQIDMNEFYV